MVVSGVPDPKPATMVASGASIELRSPQRFVSRGGEKLDGALARLGIDVADRIWLDAGASTGGFTDRLLQGGAKQVLAVDVGYGQLDWKLRNHDRVLVMERTNVRFLGPDDVPVRPDGVTADLSFISLVTVLPALGAIAASDADLLLLVKPQFEVGKDDVGKGGVVRDPDLWCRSLEKVVAVAEDLGFGLMGACVAEPPGPAGNREFFVHLKRGEDSRMDAIQEAVRAAAS